MTGLFAPVGSFDMVGLLNLLDYLIGMGHFIWLVYLISIGLFEPLGSFDMVGLFELVESFDMVGSF